MQKKLGIVVVAAIQISSDKLPGKRPGLGRNRAVRLLERVEPDVSAAVA